jgi:hypothetical protein
LVRCEGSPSALKPELELELELEAAAKDGDWADLQVVPSNMPLNAEPFPFFDIVWCGGSKAHRLAETETVGGGWLQNGNGRPDRHM